MTDPRFHNLDRRQFLRLGLGATLVSVVLGACGSTTAAPGGSSAATSAAASAQSTAGSSSGQVASASAVGQPSPSVSPAGVAASPAPSTPVPSGKLQEVKVGTIPTIADSAAIIAERRGYFAEAGMKTSLVAFKSGVEAIPAITTGQVDAASSVTLTVALVNAVKRGLTLKAVAATGTDTADRPWSGAFAIADKQDKPISSLKDFKLPVRIATTGDGTLPQAMALLLAKRDGVPASSLSLVTMGLPDMSLALSNGSVDVAGTAEPFMTLGEQKNILKRWVSYGSLLPNVTVGAMFFSDTFVQKDRAAGERFIEAWLRGARDYEDAVEHGKNLSQIESIVQERTNTPPAVFEAMIKSKAINWLDPNGHLDVQPWQAIVEVWKELGQVTSEFSAATLVDASYAEKAVAKLGTYTSKSN